MRLTIDGQLFATALSVPLHINGYAQPVFSAEERARILAECVRLGWDAPNDDYDGIPSHLAGWEELPDGTWTVQGWVWEEVQG
jgi:hypothetical protein